MSEESVMIRRDEIIFGNVDRSRYGDNGMGIRTFKHLPLVKVKQLLNEGLLEESDQHNESPSVEEFVRFMELYPDAKVGGFTTSDQREKYGDECFMSIDRIDLSTGDPKAIAAFAAQFHDADDFRCKWDDNAKIADCMAWWD